MPLPGKMTGPTRHCYRSCCNEMRWIVADVNDSLSLSGVMHSCHHRMAWSRPAAAVMNVVLLQLVISIIIQRDSHVALATRSRRQVVAARNSQRDVRYIGLQQSNNNQV